MTACYEKIRKEKKISSSSHNSVLDIFKSSLGPRASPSGLFYIGDDDPDDTPTVQQRVPPLQIVTYFSFHFSFVNS